MNQNLKINISNPTPFSIILFNSTPPVYNFPPPIKLQLPPYITPSFSFSSFFPTFHLPRLISSSGRNEPPLPSLSLSTDPSYSEGGGGGSLDLY